MKLFSTVPTSILPVRIRLSDTVTVLGSCFADGIGTHMTKAGVKVCHNPFGTVYNPISILESIRLLNGSDTFTDKDCVEMGAGAGMICSFRHHSTFARKSSEEFLENANASLEHARALWRESSKLIITLGTAMVWEAATGPHKGMIVSNCLKRPSTEFTHRMLSLQETESSLKAIIDECQGKQCIFTVSPVRHLGQGAELNTISKAILNISLSNAIDGRTDTCRFPAYEIMLDELRDYRFYAEDLCHPSQTAIDYIWERFVDAAMLAEEKDKMRANEKAARQSAHRPILK